MTRIDRLRKIADLLLDARLAEVQAADRTRRESLSHLADLQVPPVADDPASVRVALRYEQWADARRVTINGTLARQTADWLEAQDRARAAFGRAQVLKKL